VRCPLHCGGPAYSGALSPQHSCIQPSSSPALLRRVLVEQPLELMERDQPLLFLLLWLRDRPSRRQNPHQGGDRREPRVMVRTHIDDLAFMDDRPPRLKQALEIRNYGRRIAHRGYL
jgi:hypothetical protein